MFIGGGDNEVSKSFGAIAFELIPSFTNVVHRYNSVIVAIREGGERQAVRRRAFDHAATVGTNSGEEGDMHSQANEAYGELDGRVYMTLRGICDYDNVALLLLRHDYLTYMVCEYSKQKQIRCFVLEISEIYIEGPMIVRMGKA